MSDVIELVAYHSGMRPEKLRANLDYNLATTVIGLDAEDLMTAFQSKFGVDMTGFVFERYFAPEQPVSLLGIWYRLTNQNPYAAKFEAVTVRDLINAAEARAWAKE